jgi:disulfide bond formation protein DsbB
VVRLAIQAIAAVAGLVQAAGKDSRVALILGALALILVGLAMALMVVQGVEMEWAPEKEAPKEAITHQAMVDQRPQLPIHFSQAEAATPQTFSPTL